ncbi:hypothetical protein B0G84_3291 [Paraburkholderia sp. BL8N3]|nr:hypothetical protein B0G84_3291 [Paraburkholderia sp. BL8N3]
MHRCPWPECDHFVAKNKFACRDHWARMPNHLRLALGRAYRHGINDGTHPD